MTSLQFVFQEDSRLRLSPFSLVCLFRHLNLFIKIRIKEQIGLLTYVLDFKNLFLLMKYDTIKKYTLVFGINIT